MTDTSGVDPQSIIAQAKARAQAAGGGAPPSGGQQKPGFWDILKQVPGEFLSDVGKQIAGMATMPGDVYAGKVDPNSPEAGRWAAGMGLAMTPDLMKSPSNAMRRTQPIDPTAPQQGPWGPMSGGPVRSPVPGGVGGPTPETLAAGDQAQQQAAYNLGLTRAVGNAANRSVQGFNLATRNRGSAAGQSAVEQALNLPPATGSNPITAPPQGGPPPPAVAAAVDAKLGPASSLPPKVDVTGQVAKYAQGLANSGLSPKDQGELVQAYQRLVESHANEVGQLSAIHQEALPAQGAAGAGKPDWVYNRSAADKAMHDSPVRLNDPTLSGPTGRTFPTGQQGPQVPPMPQAPPPVAAQPPPRAPAQPAPPPGPPAPRQTYAGPAQAAPGAPQPLQGQIIPPGTPAGPGTAPGGWGGLDMANAASHAISLMLHGHPIAAATSLLLRRWIAQNPGAFAQMATRVGTSPGRIVQITKKLGGGK